MRDTMTSTVTKALAAGAFALGCGLALVGRADAQGGPQGQQLPQGQQQPQRPQSPPPKQQTKRPAAPEGATGGSEVTLRQRIEQLEEQLVDLQVVVGTVESLARGGPSTAATAFRGGVPIGGGGLSGAESGRIAALETQVQALTAQLEQMSDQIRALQSGGMAPRGPSGPAPRSGFGAPTVVPPGGQTGGGPTAGDPIAGIINREDQRGAAPARAPGPGGSTPASRQQYEQAYSLLLQQNYSAAEDGFNEFLQRHPADELTPNAQFWLGETLFVRGQWDNAAAAFLKVAQSHPKSDKAPDSLAKFAMAMERKGNKPAACRALQELRVRYPNPPAHVKTWEAAERRRAACT